MDQGRLTLHHARMLIGFTDTVGIAIEYTDDFPEDRDGEYTDATRTIRVRAGLHARKHRSVFAHELRHAACGHVPSRLGHVNAKQERRAEEWERSGSSPSTRTVPRNASAMDIAVPCRSSSQSCTTQPPLTKGLLLRLCPTTYLDPRVGSHQWAQKIES